MRSKSSSGRRGSSSITRYRGIRSLVSSQGLGYRLNAYSTNYNITGALAVVFLMMVIMLVLTAITNAIEARILRWRPKASEHVPAQS